MVKILTYDPKKAKQVLAGTIDKNNVFIKKVTAKHYHRKLQAYAIQEEVLLELSEKGVKKVRILSPKNTYETRLSDWLNGTRYVFIRDYGHGKQRFFPVCRMKKIK